MTLDARILFVLRPIVCLVLVGLPITVPLWMVPAMGRAARYVFTYIRPHYSLKLTGILFFCLTEAGNFPVKLDA